MCIGLLGFAAFIWLSLQNDNVTILAAYVELQVY